MKPWSEAIASGEIIRKEFRSKDCSYVKSLTGCKADKLSEQGQPMNQDCKDA